MATKTINVTQEDINYGVRVSASFCPVARALTRAFGVDCSVSGAKIQKYPDSDTIINIKTPAVVKQFISAFDHRQPVKPFTFELEENN